MTWSSLEVGKNAVSAQVESCCVYVQPPKIMLHMHGDIPYMFGGWNDPVVHLLLLQSSMTKLFIPWEGMSNASIKPP